MDEKTNDAAKPVAAKSIDPAALEMLAHADECGIGTAFSRADAMKPCPIGESGACCRICSHGPLPPGRQGRRAEDRHLRRRHGHHRLAPLRAPGRRRRGRPLRPRPRHGHDAARRRHGRGRGLQGQGRAEAALGGRLPRHPDAAAARSTRSPSTWPTRRSSSSASRTARSSTRSARRRSARRSGASWASPLAPSTARSSRSCTAPTRAWTSTPRTSSSPRSAAPWPTAGAAPC